MQSGMSSMKLPKVGCLDGNTKASDLLALSHSLDIGNLFIRKNHDSQLVKKKKRVIVLPSKIALSRYKGHILGQNHLRTVTVKTADQISYNTRRSLQILYNIASAFHVATCVLTL